MILLIQDRKNNHHIVDYCSTYGSKYTLCGLIYRRPEIINTFALDGPVSDVCQKCHEVLDKSTTNDLNGSIRSVKGDINANLRHKYRRIQMKIDSTAGRYNRVLTRYWPKLNKMKRAPYKNR
jgi:hypothetical protein